jgi:fluoride ion exporter CrcB/FEX
MLFNPVYPQLPLGTLAANLLGGCLMRLAMV